MHRVSRLDDVDDLLRIAVDQRNLPGIAQVTAKMLSMLNLFCCVCGRLSTGTSTFQVALISFRPNSGGCGGSCCTKRAMMSTSAGDNSPDVPQFGIPAGEPWLNEYLEVFRALRLRDVRGQGLAGRALAQHAVAARATLEINLLRVLEFLHGHVGSAGRDAHLGTLDAGGRRRALVFQLGNRGRVLCRRIGLDASVSAFARSAATRSGVTLPPLLPQLLRTYVRTSAICCSESCVIAGITN
jgi:hypothetical protein